MATNPIVTVGPSTGFTAETAMGTTPQLPAVPVGGQGYFISGVLTFAANAAASTITIRIRQGSGTTGTVVYTSPVFTVGAAAVTELTYAALDATAATSGVSQYTVTATASLAATAGVATFTVQPASDWD